MRFNIKYAIVAVILLTAALLVMAALMWAQGSPGGYTVKPGTGSPEDIIASGVTTSAASVSFWQLPLWIQAAGALDSMLILECLLYSAPFVLGRLQNVLENRTRLDIFNYVIGNPGCTPSEISSRQKMNNGTVKYHVRMLEAQGMIIFRRMGKYVRLFNSPKANSELEKTVMVYTKNETSRNILCAILDEPGVTNRKLSDMFSLDKSSIHWHLERFINARLVKFEQDGRNKKYFLEPEVAGVLEEKQTPAIL